PVRARDAERAQERARVLGERLQRVLPRRRLAAPVTADVVAQDAIARRERGHGGIPHREIGGDRVAQRDDRRAGRAVERIVDLDAVRAQVHWSGVRPPGSERGWPALGAAWLRSTCVTAAW